MSVGIYAYCVLPGTHVVRRVTGIGGVEVRPNPIGALTVLISEIERPEPSLAHVQQHNAVVEAVVTEDVTPVPLRFGQWADGIEAFEKGIREKADWYAERLAAFAGAMEFGLRVARPERAEQARDVRAVSAATGAEYMNALRDRVVAERGAREEVEGVRSGISDLLGDLIREERVEAARTPHGVITVSHLVSRDHFDSYRDRAQHLRERFPELRFLLSGPWVPYSFAV